MQEMEGVGDSLESFVKVGACGQESEELSVRKAMRMEGSISTYSYGRYECLL